MAARRMAAARCISHRWYGQQLCWSRRGLRVTPHRSLHRHSMRYDADRRRGGLVFTWHCQANLKFPGPEGIENATGSLRPHSGWQLSSPAQSPWVTAATAAAAAGPQRTRSTLRVAA